MTSLLLIWKTITARGPIAWLRNLFYIVRNYRGDLTMIVRGVDTCLARTEIVERYVRKATKAHIDIPANMQDDYTRVIIIGKYRGKDHVQIFNLRPGSIDILMNQLRDLQRYADVVRVDSPFEIDATVKRAIIQ